MSHLPTTEHMKLDTLPTEIQDVIFHYIVFDSTLDQLKLLRQCTRYFRDRADIYLFHTLHISASTASLERIRLVSESTRLNMHVRELVFHRGTFFGHKMARAARHFEVKSRSYDDFETYVVRASKHVAPKDMMRISQCYANFNEELQFENRFNQEMTWRSTLRKPLSKFTKLEQLTTLASADDLESEYLRKRCALTHQTWTPNYFAPYEIFEPCGPRFKPKSLSMDSVNGEDFASVVMNIRGGEAAVAERFADLRHLHLSFSETVISLEVTGTWDVFIRSCVGLKTLSIDLSTFLPPKVVKEPDTFPRRLLDLVLAQHFPALQTLDLINPVMTEDAFASFLDTHRQSLTSLDLNSWCIPVDPITSLPTGSVLRSFWKIGNLNLPRLQTVRLGGEFSNDASCVGWGVWAKHDSALGQIPGSDEVWLRVRLERYMTRAYRTSRAGTGAGAGTGRGGVTNIEAEGGSSVSQSSQGQREDSPDFWPLPMNLTQMESAKTGTELADLDLLPRSSADLSFCRDVDRASYEEMQLRILHAEMLRR